MKKHELPATEVAMRALLMVQQAEGHDAHFLMGELAERLCNRLGVCRATAFRHLRLAIDVLGISYDGDPTRALRRRSRSSDGRANAGAYGYPNGVPGRERRQP